VSERVLLEWAGGRAPRIQPFVKETTFISEWTLAAGAEVTFKE